MPDGGQRCIVLFFVAKESENGICQRTLSCETCSFSPWKGSKMRRVVDEGLTLFFNTYR